MGDTAMRAMCPQCGGKGCDGPNCVDGYLQVRFAEGDWFTRQCLNHVDCGFVNGGRICEGFPPESSELCVMCKGPTQWVLFDEAVDGEGCVVNRDAFALKVLGGFHDHMRDFLDEVQAHARSLSLLSESPPSIEECRLLNMCGVCRGKASPSKEMGAFRYATWSHERCEAPDVR